MTAAKKELLAAWDMTDDKQANWFIALSIKYDRDARRLTVHQTRYIEDMAKRFQQDGRVASVPMSSDPDASMSPTSKAERDQMQQLPYRSLIGSLLYARLTRPDIVQAVSKLAGHQNNPGMKHWKMALQVLRYLYHTRHLGLQFEGKHEDSQNFAVSVYVDADWAADKDNRRSRSGIMVFINGNLVHYTSKHQKSVALSTCEAEYVALSDAAKAALWVTQILDEIGMPLDLPVQFHEDNKAVTDLVKHPGASLRTRHVAIRYHHVQELHANGFLRVKHIGTKKQHADILTKTLPKVDLNRIRDKLLRRPTTDRSRCP